MSEPEETVALLEEAGMVVADDTVVLNGLGDCIVGMAGDSIVYSYELLVTHFMREGLTWEEAVEWVDFNICGFGISGAAPVVMNCLDRFLHPERRK